MSDNTGEQQHLNSKTYEAKSKYIVTDEEQKLSSSKRKSIAEEPGDFAEERSISGRELELPTHESSATLSSTLSFDRELVSKVYQTSSAPNQKQIRRSVLSTDDSVINESILELVPLPQAGIKPMFEVTSNPLIHRDSDSTINSPRIKEAADTDTDRIDDTTTLKFDGSKEDPRRNASNISLHKKSLNNAHKDYCIDILPVNKISSETGSITSEKQKKYLSSLLNIRRNTESAKYLSIKTSSKNQSLPTSCCSGIRKRTLQYWCHTMTMFSLLYVIISTLYVVATTVGLFTYQYTYSNVSNKKSAQLYYKIISRTILLESDILLNLNISEISINGSFNQSNTTDFYSYIEMWKLCTLDDQNKYNLDCKCCNRDEFEQRQQKRQDEIELCLMEADAIININILSNVVRYIVKKHNSTIETSDIYDTERYAKSQRETIYEVRKVVQLVAILFLAISFGLCLITWLFQKCLERCCSRGIKCFEMCCSKVILDEPDPADDQVLIDKALAARRSNRVHSNITPSDTESLQIDKNIKTLKSISKAKIAMSGKGAMDKTRKNYMYKIGNDIN